MLAFVDDLRLAARALRRAPTFAAVAIGSLAIGIGANVAVFSLVDSLLLRPLPVPAADRLVRIGRATQAAPFGPVSLAEYREISAAVAPLAEVIGHYPNSAILTAAGEPQPTWLELVSANYFDALAVRPILGRGFTAEDDRAPNASPVIVISHRLWRERFDGDSAVIGRGAKLNGRAFTVVGVAPEGFRGTFTGFAIDAWVPVMMQAAAVPGAGSIDRREDRFLMLLARRRPLADESALGAPLSVVASRLRTQQENPRDDVRLQLAGAGGVHPFVAGLVRAFLGLLQGVVLLVLVIACVNLANVLLVRGSVRRRELALRAALGASRWRLARLVIAESVVIAACGGLAGTVLAVIAGRALERLDLPVGIPVGLTIGADATVLAMALAVTLITAIVFAVGPALAASRADALAELRVAGATADRHRARVRGALVGAQVAVATVLLVAAGLAIRSLQRSTTLQPGFESSGVHVVSASPELLGYDEDRGRALWEEIAARTSRVSGVASTSLALFVPLGSRGDGLSMAPVGPRRPPTPLAYNIVRAGYFGVLGIPLVAGRDLAASDDRRAPDATVVSAALARRFFGRQNAVGESIRIVDREGRLRDVRIVGVARDIKVRYLGEPPTPIAFLPFGQWYRPDMVLHVRVASGADRVLPAVVQQIRAIEPDLALQVESMARATAFSMIPLRVAGSVLGFCGVVGLFLASLGVFGLVAYAVSLRTREIGIRVALGAGRRALTRLVVFQALRPVAVGLVIGLAISTAAGGLMRGLLVGIRPIDPLSIAAAAGVLLASAAAALIVPFRRALAVDPARVLRNE